MKKKTNNDQKVRISEFTHRENNYTVNTQDGSKSYRAVDLIEASKDLEPFDLALQGIAIGSSPWGSSIKSFVFHYERVNNADLKYPIILDDEGFICDGWHRVAKAILNGQTHIKAVRLEVMPEPAE